VNLRPNLSLVSPAVAWPVGYAKLCKRLQTRQAGLQLTYDLESSEETTPAMMSHDERGSSSDSLELLTWRDALPPPENQQTTKTVESQRGVKRGKNTHLISALCFAVVPKLLTEGLNAEQITRQREFDTHHDGIRLYG